MTDALADMIGNAGERTLMAAVPLPSSGALTDGQRARAMQNFGQYMREHDLNAEHVARQLGTPRAGTIGELLSGKYRSTADAHIRALNLWVEQHALQRDSEPTARQYISTKVARAIERSARLVFEDQVMGLLVGPTGIGKTRCALALSEKYVGSVYVRVARGTHTARGLVHALTGLLKVREAWRSPTYQTSMERVLARLKQSGRLLVIDEAHQLKRAALEVLRDIHDVAGVPILLLATDELLTRVQKDATPDRGQLYSRFAVMQHLTEGYEGTESPKSLFTIDDIKALYADPMIRLAPDAGQFLKAVANDLGRGSLRRAAHLLRSAARIARKHAGSDDAKPVLVTAEHLRVAESHLRRLRREADRVAYRQQVAANAAG